MKYYNTKANICDSMVTTTSWNMGNAQTLPGHTEQVWKPKKPHKTFEDLRWKSGTVINQHELTATSQPPPPPKKERTGEGTKEKISAHASKLSTPAYDQDGIAIMQQKSTTWLKVNPVQCCITHYQIIYRNHRSRKQRLTCTRSLCNVSECFGHGFQFIAHILSFSLAVL
jgi:hypothetical protein